MIVGIDHIVLLCPAIEIGAPVYETLLGRPADWTAHDPAGSASAFFQLSHMAIELLAPKGEGPMANRLHELLAQDGPGLQTVVFASNALEEDHSVFTRRSLQPEAIIDGESTDLTTGNTRQWQRFRFDSAQSGGLRTFVLQRSGTDPLQPRPSPAGALIDLDHLVISTEQPERALTWYGARLGFNLTLDRTNPAQNSRLLTFSAGTAKIEVTHRASNTPATKPDRLWGITWRTADIDATLARMHDSGLATSEIRQGMRRGTRVFTVRDGTLGVPTLIVANIEDEFDPKGQ
jgi:catechol 2,3-dioxygenase-like lactoylglutathione lyase family enzyme